MQTGGAGTNLDSQKKYRGRTVDVWRMGFFFQDVIREEFPGSYVIGDG